MPPQSFSDVIEQTKLRESYMSFLMGLGAVLLIGVVVLVGLRIKHFSVFQNTPPIVSPSIKKPTVKQVEQFPLIYTVQEGDDLKKISEKFYHTPELSMQIARANTMSNPDVLDLGIKLTIPKIDKKMLINQQNTTAPTPIAGDSYTVGGSDLLWDIAVRAYGDGFQWEKIAKANNILTPDAIVPGMVLKIPR